MKNRGYKQHCGVARALDVVGSRWTLLIVRNLLLGPMRFTDIQRSLPGIASNLLTDRLRSLEVAGVVEHVFHPGAAGEAYILTERGYALEPAILELGRWGWPLMADRAPEDTGDPAWALLSLKRRFRPTGHTVRIEIDFGRSPFNLRIDDDGVRIRRGVDPHNDALIWVDWDDLAQTAYGAASWADLLEQGAITIIGDQEAAEVFRLAFDLNP